MLHKRHCKNYRTCNFARDQGGVLLCRGGLSRTGAGDEMRQRHIVQVPPVRFS